MNVEQTIPEYAIHDNDRVCGFFGTFRFLSNFFPSQVHYEGLEYPSVEHAYQAAKWPPNKRDQFTMCSASEAKKLGKKSPNFKVSDWEEKKYFIMAGLVLQKFVMNQPLKEMLLATEDAYLEETNSWNDCYWGVNEDGEGKNNLGRILMGVRETIKKNKL
jgi:ribA/ribD-fused uncharacterized protein